MLDALFEAARSEAPRPGDGLMARVLADAAEWQPAPGASSPAAPRESRGWRSLLPALGGWQGVSGLAAAALAGVWIGAASPFLSTGAATSAALDPLEPASMYGLAAIEELSNE